MKKFNYIECHIDAENISAKKIGSILNRIENYGDICAKYCYADFSHSQVKPWLEACNENAIKAIQAMTIVTHKNTSDLALVNGVMKSMAREQADLIVIVSSDSDFTSTVMELREAGIYTIGVGEKKAPAALRKAYNEFWFIEDFSVDSGRKANLRPNTKRTPGKSSFVSSRSNSVESKIVQTIIEMKVKEHKNWVSVGEVGNELKVRNIRLPQSEKLVSYLQKNKKFIVSHDKQTNALIVTVNREYCR